MSRPPIPPQSDASGNDALWVRWGQGESVPKIRGWGDILRSTGTGCPPCSEAFGGKNASGGGLGNRNTSPASVPQSPHPFIAWPKVSRGAVPPRNPGTHPMKPVPSNAFSGRDQPSCVSLPTSVPLPPERETLSRSSRGSARAGRPAGPSPGSPRPYGNHPPVDELEMTVIHSPCWACI